MQDIQFIDRVSGQLCTEKVYAGGWLRLMYGDSLMSRGLGRLVAKGVARSRSISKLAGWVQRRRWTKRQIQPFIDSYQLDSAEFADHVQAFTSFNDFFCRRLVSSARPIAQGADVAVLPADGRYRFFPDASEIPWLDIKGRRLSLPSLLASDERAKRYRNGTVVLARLCPSDYHRFHFPIDCVPGPALNVPGFLYSVNPWALRQRMTILSQNRRQITTLATEKWGEVLFVEIGATCVGTIHQTYTPEVQHSKGDEKGYFSFGGSAIVMLFEPERLQLTHDLLALSRRELEVRCLMGQPLGHAR